MKKILVLTMAMLMLFTAFAGCSSNDSNTQGSANNSTNEDSSTEDQNSGSDLGAITVVSREDGSGTRSAFEEILEIEDQCAYANELDSTGAVMARVASTPGAIGYISLDVLDDSVKALTLDGVEATAENIQAGSYFLSRPFVMATNGEISAQNELVQALFDYVYSEEGQELVSSVGLITVE